MITKQQLMILTTARRQLDRAEKMTRKANRMHDRDDGVSHIPALKIDREAEKIERSARKAIKSVLLAVIKEALD